MLHFHHHKAVMLHYHLQRTVRLTGCNTKNMFQWSLLLAYEMSLGAENRFHINLLIPKYDLRAGLISAHEPISTSSFEQIQQPDLHSGNADGFEIDHGNAFNTHAILLQRGCRLLNIVLAASKCHYPASPWSVLFSRREYNLDLITSTYSSTLSFGLD